MMKTSKKPQGVANVVCPYCDKPLSSETFEGGKWRCQECGKLLDYETFKEFYEKN